MKKFFLLAIILLPFIGSSQQLMQSVRGLVTDKMSRIPLAGATVTGISAGTTRTAVADSNGTFLLNDIPVGRVIISASNIGFKPFATDPLIISSAKQLYVPIEMIEDKSVGSEVVVTTHRNAKQPVNPYALVSGRSFSPEETQRYAASANDPSRMALAFPGVQATRDTRSDIIIRGNNPVGMQWRLEGVDIPNPNHFARKGSSGGGITIFSLSMLDQSDFLTGAMPAEYGDVLSGVFDMKFRKGNNQQQEYSFKAGMIGLDFSTEGPIRKNQSSYLVNYRYSTLGLLGALGINLVDERESDTFQDLSFNLAFANKKNTSNWNVWGMGGISIEKQKEVADVGEWKQYDDYAIYDFRTKMGAIGVGHNLTLNSRSSIRSALVVSGQQILYVDDTLNKRRVATRVNDEHYTNGRISFASSYNYKWGATANMKAGFYANSIYYNLHQTRFDYLFWTYKNAINGEGNTWLLQPYWQMSIKPAKKWTINPGVHLMYLALNKRAAIDPRLSIQYKVNSRQSLSFAYGLHSKILPLGTYFYQQNPALPFPNHDLKMMRSHHYIASYDLLMNKGWRLRSEVYYQRLFNIPVVNEVNRTYWLLNDLEGYAKEALVSEGKGTNTGMDISVEKFLNRKWFLVASFSLFNSTFEPLGGKVYSTRFNSQTSGSFTGAREWKLKKNGVLQFGWKLVYNGGLPLTPLANYPSGNREPVLDELRPYSERIPAYFRTDTRISFRKDKQKISWQLALDVQNIFGIKNIDGLNRRYDPSVNQWIYREQSGLVPVLSYQIDF